ncbi:10 TM acyl transferase domain found in Cas1p-domain-containing protein [Scleroderma yunnanense]
MSTKRLEPSWHDILALSILALSVLAGLFRWPLFDQLDPLRCDALVTKGSWLDDAHRNWQPEGCMLHQYQPKDASRCLASRRVVFAGDSVTRTLYFQLVHLLDPKLPGAPPQDNQKHSDHSFVTSTDITLDFIWDPFLNTTSVLTLINPKEGTPGVSSPALLVLGSGLWYLRYANSSGSLPAWEAMVQSHIDAITTAPIKPAEEVVFLPVEDVVTSKLSPERYNTMHSSDIDAMNSDLYHRIKPSYTSSFWSSLGPTAAVPVRFPLVFNKLLGDSLTEDGLHFSSSVIQIQANILLNLRCNNGFPPTAPMDKTCCRAYPWPSPIQFIVLTVIVTSTVISLCRLCVQNYGKGYLPTVIFGAAVYIIYIADRTGLWLKEQKQYNSWVFAFLCFISLAAGIATVRRSDKDMGFLNRDQSDEWKGWMQIAILIYHYLGASKVSGIYNPIRVLVAAYLFMTGYGHTTFYLKKADFGFVRIAQVMIRLNLLTVMLVYTMNTNYLSYYFTPLVSMWFLIIYATMAIGSTFNDNTLFLVCKILCSMTTVAMFMKQSQLLASFFGVLKQIFSIDWSAREWTFRVTLDLYIVYFGMLTAVAVIKIREHHLTDHPMWPALVKAACGCSVLVLMWFFGFELNQESKFTYNAWHPYISFLPIVAFVVLRNASPLLRSCTSRAFAFIGKCSLETFIIQFHFWLAGDTKGILIIPGTKWRPLNFVITSIIFVYVSHHVAWASGEITSWICDQREKPLPTNSRLTHGGGSSGQINGNTYSEAVSLVAAGEDQSCTHDESCASDPNTQPQHWIQRFRPHATHYEDAFRIWNKSQFGLKGKVAIAVVVMWIANILW